jgi:hypothetical protein
MYFGLISRFAFCLLCAIFLIGSGLGSELSTENLISHLENSITNINFQSTFRVNVHIESDPNNAQIWQDGTELEDTTTPYDLPFRCGNKKSYELKLKNGARICNYTLDIFKIERVSLNMTSCEYVEFKRKMIDDV